MALAVLALLPSCSASEAFERPQIAVPAAFGSEGASAAPVEAGSWWKHFGDTQLDGLIARAFAANPTIAQAAARVRQARARERIVRAAGSPAIDAAAQAGYTRISEHAIPAFPGSSETDEGAPAFGLPGMDFTTFRAGFDASWEADLFGGRKHEEQAAAERIDAALWSERDIRVTLAAEIGDAYIRYRALQRRLALADERLASEHAILDFVGTRVRNGLASSIEMRRQEQSVAEAAAAREALTADRDVLLHALAILLGEPPKALAEALAAPKEVPGGGFAVPAGLPSELLLRRPDLRAAERRLAAATSDVGAARAALFPKIGLTGALHLVSTSLANLLAPGSVQINAAARLSLPILDGGRRRATVDLRRAEADEAAQTYRADVLAALADVEDALTRLEAERRRLEHLAAFESAARDAAGTAEVRYRNGLIPFTEVIEARQRVIEAQDAEVQARAAAAGGIVSLYKALGGGWDREEDTYG